ncbi:histidine kinase [Actinotalea sp. AC32]|nr:histidine kinase [Actinotalea sp. AC32]
MTTTPDRPFTVLGARRLGPVRRFFARRPVAMDVVVMAWFGIPALLTAVIDPARPSTVVATVAVVLAGITALAWRRHRPVLVAGVIGVLAVVAVLVSGTFTGFDLAVGLVVYAVAASHPPRTAWTVAGALAVTTGLASWLWETPVPGVLAADDDGSRTDMRLASITGVVVFTLAAMAIGTSVRNSRLHLADLVDRANAIARDRDQQTQLARAAERTRIAREMHDVVAHSLSVMIALADGASAALDRAPDRSRTALGELSETGRSALADMRRILGVLQEPEAPLEPQPGVVDVDALVERFRATGLPVRTTGLTTPLPDDAGMQLAVYRILQESLTNALRYAPGARAVDVAVRRTPRAVELEVTDTGATLPHTDPGGSGNGLIGMRERAAVYGGTVDAGPHGTGWRVHAVLPWPADGPADAPADDPPTTPGDRS